ncbi:hypothetical protein [Coleofasciculus sp. F4-SAH-05]|jgi:hypothetical protein|uniref:hypothetical protein n=1 Tax=Coleofasciculus sp. F4-SAH-05 TaxID=3069525 RepID=UPI0032FBE136
MYKIEKKLDGNFVNNFHDGSIYDLVFIDLEFWPDYVNKKPVQRIYGYTITRILKSSKQQFIKIKFLEYKNEEKQLVNEIISDIYALKNKIFIGFNIKDSDFLTLKRRLNCLSIKSQQLDINFFDFAKINKEIKRQGLNKLFKNLGVKSNKKINGKYFRKNTKKILAKSNGWIDCLLNMFEYCLEDAAAYFELVANWNKKFSVVTKEMIIGESLVSYRQNLKSDHLQETWILPNEEDYEITINPLLNAIFYEEIERLWYDQLLDDYWQ